METWISDIFPKGDIGFIVYKTDSQMIQVTPSSISTLFGLVGKTPSYAALLELPCAKAGWMMVFDQWKEQGLIS